MFDLLFPKRWSTLKKLIWLKAAALSSAVQKTLSGAILSIKDALAMPAIALSVNVDPVQSGSGDPAPDNVRPITGHTECNIYHETDYDPTANPSYTITFPDAAGTVYGGTLDVTNGVLTVERAAMTPTVSSLQSVNAYGIANFQFSISPKANQTSAIRSKAISNCLKTQNFAIASAKEPGIMVGSNGISGYLRLYSTDASTKEQANTWIAVNNCLLVYYLEEPITVTLTAQQITLLAGENTLWADTGDSTLTYMADGKADDLQALNILLGGRYVNHGEPDEATDAEALNILLGR